MPESTPLTGYPAIDKPWMKYYSNETIKGDIPKTTIFSYMHDHSAPYSNTTAITYYGATTSYHELYDQIYTAARVLQTLGIKKGDRILCLMPNIPETTYLFYGSSLIGAIMDYVDPRPDSTDVVVSAKKIYQTIIKEKCSHIVSLDQCYLAMLQPIERQLKDYGINQIIIVSAADSLDAGAKAKFTQMGIQLYGLAQFTKKLKRNGDLEKLFQSCRKKSELDILLYKDLAKNVNVSDLSLPPCDPDDIVCITHTSGTTGAPKPIAISHDNLNAYAHQSLSLAHEKTGVTMPLNPGDRVLHILPYFAAYGVSNIVHAGLSHATNLIEIPEVETQHFGKLVYLNKAAISVGIPSWYLAMRDDPYLEGKSLDFIRFMSFGGIGMTDRDEESVNQFLAEHGAKIKLSKGHGMSEICGCGSLATGTANPLGSMGIPLPKTTYAIVDPDTKEMLRYHDDSDGIDGEIAISTRTLVGESFDGVTYFQVAEYWGDRYILTGDIGHMDKNGFLSFDSRNDRGFSRYDGFKVKPGHIEKAIERTPGIMHCLITPFYDDSQKGNMICANVIVDEDLFSNHRDVVQSIINELTHNPMISTRQIPTLYRFWIEFPMTKGGKTDYSVLDQNKLSNDEVKVVLHETNVSVDAIEVISAEK